MVCDRRKARKKQGMTKKACSGVDSQSQHAHHRPPFPTLFSHSHTLQPLQLNNASSGKTEIKMLTSEQAKDTSHFKDKESGLDLELVVSALLGGWVGGLPGRRKAGEGHQPFQEQGEWARPRIIGEWVVQGWE